jgi:hypothetical protein
VPRCSYETLVLDQTFASNAEPGESRLKIVCGDGRTA